MLFKMRSTDFCEMNEQRQSLFAPSLSAIAQTNKTGLGLGRFASKARRKKNLWFSLGMAEPGEYIQYVRYILSKCLIIVEFVVKKKVKYR